MARAALLELFLSPTAMLFRNLLAMDAEEMIRAQPLDGVVLLGGCDKTIPALHVQAISAATPVVADVRPTGRYQMEDLDRAGGVPAVLRALGPLIDPAPLTVEGRALGEALRAWPHDDPEQRVIRSVEAPVYPTGGLTVLRGSLAPRGAVIKDKAATPGLLQHEGPAIVFTSIDDLERRIDDPALPVTAQSVLVLQNAGPVRAPGMPEAGSLPLPRKMLAAGVRDMVRVSDARMSGTAFGTVVLHVAPESAVGGPLVLVRDGDVVHLDVPAGRLDLMVPEEELEQRRHEVARTQPARPAPGGGYRSLYRAHVLQADEGCDFDFLRGRRSG